MPPHTRTLNFDDLKGKTVAITGGAGVLCRSFAEAFCALGAQVALLDIDGDAARARAAELTAVWGVKALGVDCDVLSEDSLNAALDEIHEGLGPVDILINGAGGNVAAATTAVEQLTTHDPAESGDSFYGLDVSAFSKAFDLNLMGTVLACQKLTPDMHRAGKGSIINISSMNAFKPLTRIPAYSAAKAAVSNFTEWLAVHLAPVGIRVNAIAPGFFLTEQLKYLAFDEAGNLTPRYERVLAKTPMARLGEPDELQGAALFLASELSSFITGIVIPVDGGFNASSGV